MFAAKAQGVIFFEVVPLAPLAPSRPTCLLARHELFFSAREENERRVELFFTLVASEVCPHGEDDVDPEHRMELLRVFGLHASPPTHVHAHLFFSAEPYPCTSQERAEWAMMRFEDRLSRDRESRDSHEHGIP